MMGPTHRLLGALTGAGYAAATGQPWPIVVLTAGIATTTSSGRFSPDGDQSWWPKVTGFAPTWVHRHRGLLHWWGIPVGAALIVPALSPLVHWAAVALIAGWASHLVGDFFFGKAARDHGPGIPLAPWGCYAGVGWKTDGILESGRRIGPLRIPSLTRAVLTVALAAVLTVSTGLNLTELAHRVGGT
jgi:hypothetical protein